MMKKRGFTLIELMVSVAIFSIISTTALGGLLAISSASRKAETLKTAMDNLSFALEGMSRNIRTGSDYHCGSGGTLTEPLDCPSTPSSFFTFLAVDGSQMTYTLVTTPASCGQTSTLGGCIKRRTVTGGGADSGLLQITAPEMIISDLSFYVLGSLRTDDIQPKVAMTLTGYVNIGSNASSTFSLQTTMTQRIYDQ